jgi:hypothetical protein
MKNSNIIVSVIIVLCIAAAVTAYGLTNNGEDNIFTNLASLNPTEDSATDGDGQNAGNGGSGSGESTGGSGSNNGGNASGISSSEAKDLVNNHYIGEEGYYAGTPKLLDGNWCVPVLDKDGVVKGEIWIDAKTGENIGGAGGAR